MFWALIRMRWSLALERLFRIALFIFIVYLAGVSIQLMARVANNNMKVVVVAVESYKAKHGQYPQSLEQLVPEFIKSVPMAKPMGSFMYSAHPDMHSLYYMTSPLGNREYYNFESKRWGYYQIDNEPPASDYDPGITSYLDQPSRWKKGSIQRK